MSASGEASGEVSGEVSAEVMVRLVPLVQLVPAAMSKEASCAAAKLHILCGA